LDGDLEEVDLEHWGPFFRYHPFFAPVGTNVNVLVIQKNGMKIRTYERGVENETLACGTGVLAAAAAADYWKKIKLPVWVDTRGGRMKVGIQPENGFLWLQGPAQHVFSGVFDPEDFG
jgi:diaminopimelate epimerase